VPVGDVPVGDVPVVLRSLSIGYAETLAAQDAIVAVLVVKAVLRLVVFAVWVVLKAWVMLMMLVLVRTSMPVMIMVFAMVLLIGMGRAGGELVASNELLGRVIPDWMVNTDGVPVKVKVVAIVGVSAMVKGLMALIVEMDGFGLCSLVGFGSTISFFSCSGTIGVADGACPFILLGQPVGPLMIAARDVCVG
jgi:hypothetical protein